MLDQPLDSIDAGALERLVFNQVSEGRNLEFKRDLPGGSDEERKEFLADITAFANSQGGDLIFGIEEERGIATNLNGIKVRDPDAEKLRLENLLRDSVSPRLIGHRMQWVRLAAERSVLIVRIPASLSAPHRVTFRNSGRFYSRNSSGKYELDVHELRHAFTEATRLPLRFRQMHAQAIQMARGVEMPFALAEAPMAVVSVIPLGILREERELPVTRDNAVVPPDPNGYSAIEMIEGVLIHPPVHRETGKLDSFAMTHRSGRVDVAWKIGGVRNDRGQEQKLVWPSKFEGALVGCGVSAQARLRALGVEGPWIVLCSIEGARGFNMIIEDGYPTMKAFRTEALVGELRVDHIDHDALLPILKNFWLLFGLPRPNGWNPHR